MNKKEKGFTLVELLVVIAIVAILATVSVVGYLSFTSKAKVSNDISLTKQMNDILLGETALEGKNKVPNDAVKDLQEQGLDVTKMTPTKEGYEFVYDLGQDKFFLLDENGKQIAPEAAVVSTNTNDVYKFVGKDGTLSNTYANYLKADYVSSGTETISTGFDAGENTTVTTLNYNNTTAKTTTIRTNGGTLTVNAPNDTLHHYGKLNSLDVLEVADHSYHEYGLVSKIEMKKGNLVLETSSKIGDVVVPTEVKKGAITISIKEEATVENIVANDPTVLEGVVTGHNLPTVKKITEVATFEELKKALTDKVQYIVLKNNVEYPVNRQGLLNITNSATIDGNGFTLSGYGLRGSNSTTLAINNDYNGTNTNVSIKNLKIVNSAAPGRCIETRGKIDSLKLENVILENSAVGANNQTITIGGDQSTPVKLDIHNSKISAENAGYGIVTFNPILLYIVDSNISGYACIYLKGKYGSQGSYGSTIKIYNSNLDAPNVHDPNGQNDFGCITTEDGGIDLLLNDCKVNATATNGAKQAILLLSSKGLSNANSTNNVNAVICGDKSFYNGSIVRVGSNKWTDSTLTIKEGQFTSDPTSFVDANSEVIHNGLYFVKKK